MKRQSLIVGLAAAALATVSVSAGQDLNKVAKLRNPAALTEQAPATYKASFDTSKGVFVIEVHRDWAPNGADRFYNLVKNGFYDDTRFFRVIPRFMVQWGMNGNPAVQQAWTRATIKDDPVKQSNKMGYVSFAAQTAPNTRTTQVFINFVDNARLDSMNFAPFGQVVQGMDVVNKINSQYGQKPSQAEIQTKGNAYLNKEFAKLDYIKTATIAN
jgi:peptidyl-prolyl cis-trans isomerase A (cyclophilin A)